ncbi:MAG: CPBP family intramembrane metalloprotease [Bacteroidales bacterium]|jgi:membrane protease YdiL (CAAX protease family)|nr:CPBP family intramembrane metalloprotease [Bacteroidales bacterium]MCI1785165.1 CPBP family intramembrane metalloprotease [Bacteroidales bacterium]
MSFFNPRKVTRSYDLYKGFSFYTPGIGGMLGLLLWLLAGAMLGNLVSAVLIRFVSRDFAMTYGMLISYPIMFLPAMMFAMSSSRNNAMFDTGYSLISSHFGKMGGAVAALLVIPLTLSVGFMTDLFNAAMPQMPSWLENLLKNMTHGTLWVNILSVSIFAPIFEEWLCRGEILRGLLNHRRKDGTTMKPVLAIVLSALFFAVIHANPWQAVPAFILGVVFGFVYYKTGSLWLTMIMHCTNNTFALIMSNVDSLKDVDNWLQVMNPVSYAVVFVFCLVIAFVIIRMFCRIPLQSPAGNCDPVDAGSLIS